MTTPNKGTPYKESSRIFYEMLKKGIFLSERGRLALMNHIEEKFGWAKTESKPSKKRLPQKIRYTFGFEL
jgi:hypothetical protein